MELHTAPRTRKTELPDPIIQLIQERFFCDRASIRDIQAELITLGYEPHSASYIWKCARGLKKKHVPPSPRLLEYLSTL